MEYYAGILFLTTNRIGDFDEAFASRIHISLHYPELDLESTLKIFELNLKLIYNRFKGKGREIKIDHDNILASAQNYWNTNEKMRWNGRQIRNACQTALALAEFGAQGGSHEKVVNANATVDLTVNHLDTVSRAYLHFIMYLKDITGYNAEKRARLIGIRAREGTEKEEKGGLFSSKGPTGLPANTYKEGSTAAFSTIQGQTSQPSPLPYHYEPVPNALGRGYPPQGYSYPQAPQPQQPTHGYQPLLVPDENLANWHAFQQATAAGQALYGAKPGADTRRG